MKEEIHAYVLVINPKEGEYDYWLTVQSSNRGTPYLGYFRRPEWRKKYTTRKAAKAAGRKMVKRLGWIEVDR